MSQILQYVIFNTKYGYFGVLGTENKVLRTALPRRTFAEVNTYLLVGIEGPKSNKNLALPLQNKIHAYFSGLKTDFSEYLPSLTFVKGTGWPSSQFACDILKACANIGYGEKVSYGELAKLAGHPKAARAVGNIMGNNNLPLIIPCHRVVKADGSCGGFMQNADGGVELKQEMLKLESNTNQYN